LRESSKNPSTSSRATDERTGTRLVQEAPAPRRGQAEYQAQVHVVPGVRFEGLNFVGGHARDRFPGHQPRIGVIGVREGDRLVGI
jgi:hypothetical protein